jgi:hypothetical protein
MPIPTPTSPPQIFRSLGELRTAQTDLVTATTAGNQAVTGELTAVAGALDKLTKGQESLILAVGDGNSATRELVAATTAGQQAITDELAAISASLPSAAPKPPDLKTAPVLMLCLRAINQVEDLIVDKDYDRQNNNNELTRRKGDDLSTAARDSLPDQDPRDLQQRFDALFEEIPSRNVMERRIERILAIQVLRADLYAHFAGG